MIYIIFTVPERKLIYQSDIILEINQHYFVDKSNISVLYFQYRQQALKGLVYKEFCNQFVIYIYLFSQTLKTFEKNKKYLNNLDSKFY